MATHLRKVVGLTQAPLDLQAASVARDAVDHGHDCLLYHLAVYEALQDLGYLHAMLSILLTKHLDLGRAGQGASSTCTSPGPPTSGMGMGVGARKLQISSRFFPFFGFWGQTPVMHMGQFQLCIQELFLALLRAP